MADRSFVKLNIAPSAEHSIQVQLVTRPFAQELADGKASLAGMTNQPALALTRFRGDLGTSFPATESQRVHWLVGCGSEFSTQRVRRAAAAATKLIQTETPWSMTVPENESFADTLRAMIEGVVLGSYQYRQTKTDRKPLGDCTLVVQEDEVAAAKQVLKQTMAVCEGILLTRDLVNMPAMDLGPQELADAAHEVADRHGFAASTFRGSDLLERGFRLVEAVGRASERPPCVTVIESHPGTKPDLALVGKGVVFDSGGLNLKATRGMLLMRKDMGGAGTVSGILDALGRLGKARNILAVIPAAENCVGPLAYRPGDIISALDGTTVEISNTDAEGRLLLADSLAFAKEQHSARILDIATLTGAARVALGPEYPALFGTDEEMVAALLQSGVDRDEPLWRMPLVPDYRDWLKTPHADVNHAASDGRAGAITAALFLERFVGNVPWSHIDVYGWEDKGKPEIPKGGNGMTVRAVVGAIQQIQDS